MAFEYERKYLVKADAWRNEIMRSDFLHQGYLVSGSTTFVRVRTETTQGLLEIHTVHDHGRRSWEYGLPREDALEILGLGLGVDEAETDGRAEVVLGGDDRTTVRVRISGGDALVTVKGQQTGEGKPEWEYEIPLSDAREIMLLARGEIEKTRHTLSRRPYVWTVDEFHGTSAGLFLLEIEGQAVVEEPDLPAWAGREVTADPRYQNSYISQHPYSSWSDTD